MYIDLLINGIILLNHDVTNLRINLLNTFRQFKYEDHFRIQKNTPSFTRHNQVR